MITVVGLKVQVMYRVDPSSEIHSGWFLLAGNETQEYVYDPQNFSLYDVNTIANDDPDIVPLLDAPFGGTFVRNSRGRFVVKETSEEK
jgi:hypothetical protein